MSCLTFVETADTKHYSLNMELSHGIKLSTHIIFPATPFHVPHFKHRAQCQLQLTQVSLQV